MESLLALREKLHTTETSFNFDTVHAWHVDHVEVPVFACCVYFLIVFWLPGVLEASKLQFSLRWQMILWNLFLAGFSMLGASRTVPMLLGRLQEMGFEDSICSDGAWFLHGSSGFWVCLFIYSKIPELVDTLFLVLKRRPVILLHWFHHCTVLMFCWHAYALKSGPGMWFATMNYCVHAIMYSYYAAMAAKLGKVLSAIAPLITGLQILQMLFGLIVVVTAGKKLYAGEPCAADAANMKLGFAMYLSYFVLFFMLFLNKYVSSPCKDKRSAGKDDGRRQVLCGVDIKNTDTTGCVFEQQASPKAGKGADKKKSS